MFSHLTPAQSQHELHVRGGKINSAFPCPYLLHLNRALSPQIHRVLVSPTSQSVPCLWRFGDSRKEGPGVRPEWDQACVKPGLWCSTEGSAFHRDHSPVSFAPAFLPLETSYWCFLSFNYHLLLYRPFLCSKQMSYSQNTIFKCPAPGSRSLKCNTFWDAGAHKLPWSFVCDLYSSLSEQVFRKCGFL